MKHFIWLAILFLVGCSTAPRKQTLFEYSQALYQENPSRHSTVAGPDIRYSGELFEIMHSTVWFKHPTNKTNTAWEKGFKAGHNGSVLKEVETAAIEACEAQNGQGKCYVYLKNGRNVRLVERKKWLARNPSEVALIAEEKAEHQQRLNRQAQASVTTTYSPTAKTEADYEAASQLFDIANQALKSTMPQPIDSVNCTTMSSGYLTGTLITNCR